jgi:ATP-binding cassette subfamily B protein
VGARINISLASDFLIKMMKLPVSFFDSKITGDVLQRMQDSRRIETFLTSSPNTLFSVFNMIIFLGVLLFYNYHHIPDIFGWSDFLYFMDFNIYEKKITIRI